MVSEGRSTGTGRVVVRLVLSTVSLAASFGLAFLVLAGRVAGYEFEGEAPPSAGDVLVARIETVGSIVAAFCAVGFFVAAAAAKESRAMVVLGLLGVLIGLIYLLLIIFVSAVAF